MSKINQALLKEYLELQYPIGKTELFLDNEDHSNYMGFTWQRDSVGRAIVGLDTNDTDFNTIGKTGGSKYLQEHTHTYNISTSGYAGNDGGKLLVWNGNGSTYDGAAGAMQNAGTGNSGNLQPYKVFAIWVRTA